MTIIRFVLDRDKYRYRIYGSYVLLHLMIRLILMQLLLNLKKARKARIFYKLLVAVGYGLVFY